MKTTVAFLALLLTAVTALAGEKLLFANGKVSFVLPDGFTRMSPELAATKYPRTRVPEHVFSDSTTRVSIAAGFTPAENLSLNDLPELRTYLQQTLESSIPGIKWISNELRDLGGTKWIYFELQSEAVDTSIRNMVLFTAINCGMVSFNFNSTLKDYPQHAKALEVSRDSIRVDGDLGCVKASNPISPR